MNPQPFNAPYRADNGKIRYKLMQAFTYGPFQVPKGFDYDGGSVPRALWTVSGLTPDGLARAAYLIHDYLYRHDGRVNDLKWSREETDRLFRSMLKEYGVGRWSCFAAYHAVRRFGRGFLKDGW